MKEQGDFILLVTHLIPYPPRRGVEQRIYKLLRWLKSEGFRVILVVSASSIEQNVLVELRKVAYAVHWTRPPLRTRLGDRLPFLRKILWEPLKLILTLGRRNVSSVSTRPRLASPVGNDELKKALCPDHLVHLVRQLSRKYSLRAVIAEYIFLTPCFAAVPHGVLKIVDTIDMFSLKTTQVLGFGIDDPYACTRDEERESLMRADTVLAIQPREASLLRELVPEREVLLVGMDYQVVDGGGCDEDRSVDLLVVASDNALNVHGLRGFLAECWPRIKAACPAATLHVVGAVGNEFHFDDPAITYTKWVDDLKEVYKKARMVINPTVAGTGLKIKSVEALAHGRPLVAWAHGVEGLSYEGMPPYIECNSWQDFGEAVVSLLKSENKANALAQRAASYARSELCADRAYGELKACLSGAPLSPRKKRSLEYIGA